MTRVIALIGWVCLALDAAFVIALIVVRDAGNDAAGRGVGRGWGVVLLPVLLIAAGVLYWGTKSGSKAVTIGGTLIVALPFMLLAQGKIQQMRANSADRAQKAQHGQFGDARLNALAQAIDAGDTTGLQTLLASYKASATAPDYTQRDASGETLLGFAATRALDYSGTDDKVSALRIVLQNGVPYAADAQKVGLDWSFAALVDTRDKGVAIAAIALDAGADPNQKAQYDDYPAILSYEVRLPQLQLLVQHGADVQARNAQGESTLMNAIRFKHFPEALFFLEQGVDPDYATSDGRTARTELKRVEDEYAATQRPMEPGYGEFVAALAAHRTSARA